MSELRAKTLTNELSTLDRTLAGLRRKEGEILRRHAQLHVAIANSKTTSTVNSKVRELERTIKELAGVHEKLSATQKKRSDKESELARVRTHLQSQKERELKRFAAFEEQQRRERLSKERAFQRQMSEMRQPDTATESSSPSPVDRFDFFISHASEDKQEVARPLYDALVQLGCAVWYDEFSLKIGDSLRRNIEKGIVASRYGVIIVSEHFLKKEWPSRELDTLTSIEMTGGKKVLPIWHRVSKEQLLSSAPMLADKLALNTSSNTIVEIARELQSLLDS